MKICNTINKLTNKKTKCVYHDWFEEFRIFGLLVNIRKTNMSDFELSISIAAKEIFPNIQWNFCQFYVMQNMNEKISALKILPHLGKSITSQITIMHNCINDTEKALQNWNLFKSQLLSNVNIIGNQKIALKKFIKYFDSYYIPKIQQWILKTDVDGKTMPATNNVMERFNGKLKQIFF